MPYFLYSWLLVLLISKSVQKRLLPLSEDEQLDVRIVAQRVIELGQGSNSALANLRFRFENDGIQAVVYDLDASGSWSHGDELHYGVASSMNYSLFFDPTADTVRELPSRVYEDRVYAWATMGHNYSECLELARVDRQSMLAVVSSQIRAKRK